MLSTRRTPAELLPDHPNGLSLREFLATLNRAIAERVPAPLWVRAEISQLRTLDKGHLALELVEHDGERRLAARAQAFVWAGGAPKLLRRFAEGAGVELQAGVKVLVLAGAGLHASHGLRLVIEDIDPAYTLGDLEAKLRYLRETLARRGLLEANRKLPPPAEFCRVVVIGPPDGAGLGDFKRDAEPLQDHGLCRFDYLTARFQGSDAPESLCRALRRVAVRHAQGALHDAVCLIRGGGSVTDLAWLNDLELAQAVCLMPIPVFTGIGHERDGTILDEIAHARFGTPSKVIGHIAAVIRGNALEAAECFEGLCRRAESLLAAAESCADQAMAGVRSLSAQRLAEAAGRLDALTAGVAPSARNQLLAAEAKLDQGLDWLLARTRTRLGEADRALDRNLDQVVQGHARARALAERALENSWESIRLLKQRRLDEAEHRVEALGRELLGLSPASTLKRGFALVRDPGGAPVASAAAARNPTALEIEFHDGRVAVQTALEPKQGDRHG